MNNQFLKNDALLIVDAQVDFFPGGALPVPRGDEILPVVNQWIETALAEQIPIFFSRDWHPQNHCSFKEQGGPWPIHCVQNTKGAQIHPQIYVPADAIIVNKAEEADKEAYSDFNAKTKSGVTLDSVLKERNINRIWVAGLAQDYCVCETALDAKMNGYEVRLILKGTKPITSETGVAALKRMEEAGITFERN